MPLGDVESVAKRIRDVTNVQAQKNSGDEVPGRIVEVELENFMCHKNLKISFDVGQNNCFFIGGSNGSGKSALFASLNIGLGGRGNENERGSSVKSYVRFGQNRARIRIVMTNCGTRRHPDYEEMIAVERIIYSTNTSTYRLKSLSRAGSRINEKLVSSRKADLDRLLVHFKIQLDNPVFWMSQDRSRAFLQEFKADKIYKLFMDATGFNEVFESYDRVGAMVAGMERIKASIHDVLVQRKKIIVRLMEMKRYIEGVRKNESELNDLNWILQWLPVRDCSKKLNRAEDLIAKTNAAVNKLKDESEKHKSKTIEYEKRQQDLLAQIESLKKESKNIVEEARIKRTEELIKQKQYQDDKRSVTLREKKLDALSGEVTSIQRQISTIQEKNSERDRNRCDVPEARIQIQTIDEELAEIQQAITGYEATRRSYSQQIERLKDLLLENQAEVRRLNDQRLKWERENERVRAMKQNYVARFGVSVPAILNVIERNAYKFKHRPIGPLGMYVKVREEKWCLAVELALRPVLLKFLFDSSRDRYILDELLKAQNLKLPSGFVVSRFKSERYETTRHEPSSNTLTVLRVIEITDSYVFNAIVDQTQIESIVLFESDEEARDVMFSRPIENVLKGFTLSGGEVHARTSNKLYRFYANRDWKSCKYLIHRIVPTPESISSEISLINERIKESNLASSKVEKEHQNARQQCSGITVKITEASRRRVELDSSKRQYQRAIDRALIEDDDVGDAHAMKLKCCMEDSRKMISEERSQLEEMKKSAAISEREMRNVKKGVKRIDVELEHSNQRINKVQDERDIVAENISRIAREQREFEEKLKSVQRRLEDICAAKKTAEEEMKHAKSKAMECTLYRCPENMSNPPDMDELPNTNEVMNERDKLERCIKAMQDVADEVREEVHQIDCYKEEYSQIKDQYSQTKKCVAEFLRVLQLRREKFTLIKNRICARLENVYARLMTLRGFDGKLVIDHDLGAINIMVHTHLENASTASIHLEENLITHRRAKAAIRDLKGLSGGERSYTSACFVMALWELMEAPFRCMDEFDVFLDMNNRKIVMELLANLATCHYSNNQFLFFTPQSVNEFTNRNGIKLLEMPIIKEA